MSLLATLRGRWDVDPEMQASLPFDRVIAIVNLRRIEIVAVLELLNNVIMVWLGYAVPGVWAASALALCGLTLRLIERVRSLRVQQATVILFWVMGLTIVIWASAELSHGNAMTSGYLVNILSITMLFVMPPKTLARIICGMILIFAATAIWLPLTIDSTINEIARAAVVSGIALVAGWLIHSSRRSDYDQKRVIRTQNTQLNQRNHEREQLMAITAHDLRSPLYGLRNLLDLGARRPIGDGALHIAAMRDAVFGLDAMIALVSRLLEAHSAEHEPLTARVEEDLRGHLLAAVRRIAPAGEAAGVEVAVELPDRPLVVAFDGNALSHILDNLLGNAVRFSPPDTPVRLCCAARAEGAIVEIADEGPGFDAAGRAAMFGKFHPRNGARGAKAGTGMGLFIAASFAARMGATLTFAPNLPSGARFTLLIAPGADASRRTPPSA